MKKIITISIILVTTLTGNTQINFSPGGVKQLVHWFTAFSQADSAGFKNLRDSTSVFLITKPKVTNFLNFHPAIDFDGTDNFIIPLGNIDLSSASYFTVYKSTDTASENILWYTTKDYKAELVLTSRRMADLGTYKYMNFIDIALSTPKVNVYVEKKEKQSLAPSEQNWHIGMKPVSPELPLNSFKGVIPEFIVYDKVLNGIERIKVATYLALKYGITLTEPNATYLNSNGDEIWNGWDYFIYHHNITGIGRDDSSGLNQKIATSSNNPGLLTISTNDSLLNNTFLLWGDNGLALNFEEKIAGVPQLLKKKWLRVNSGYQNSFRTNILVDTKQIDVPSPVTPVYWLAIDSSGTGNFSVSNTSFVKMGDLNSNGIATFKNVANYINNISRKDMLAVVVAEDILLVSDIKSPVCSHPNAGSINIKILGGTPPYNLFVFKNENLLLRKSMFTNDYPIQIENLFSGWYLLKVVDANHHFYADSFYLNNSDAPKPTSIQSHYQLEVGQNIELDAATNMPSGITYEWHGPNNFKSFSPKVILIDPGIYTLISQKDGCNNEQQVIVTPVSKNNIKSVVIYPNPAKWRYNIKIELDKPAPVIMRIYASDGKLVTQRKLSGLANYTFSQTLSTNGTYQIVFDSELYSVTKKLIIIK